MRKPLLHGVGWSGREEKGKEKNIGRERIRREEKKRRAKEEKDYLCPQRGRIVVGPPSVFFFVKTIATLTRATASTLGGMVFAGNLESDLGWSRVV